MLPLEIGKHPLFLSGGSFNADNFKWNYKVSFYMVSPFARLSALV